MTRVLAIDPGNIESAYALVNIDDCEPIRFAKLPNEHLRRKILTGSDDFWDATHVAVEMVASYGMAVGCEVFETCVWIGRFLEVIRLTPVAPPQPALIYRRDVKLHHCGQTKAKDSNIRQALVDRFAPGVGNYGKGTKAHPGWFYGFSADIWQAYALAVLVADRIEGRQGVAA